MTNAAERAEQLALISRLKSTYPEVPMPDQMTHDHFLADMKNPHDVGGELDVPAAYENKEEEQWELMTYVLCEVLGMRGIWGPRSSPRSSPRPRPRPRPRQHRQTHGR